MAVAAAIQLHHRPTAPPSSRSLRQASRPKPMSSPMATKLTSAASTTAASQIRALAAPPTPLRSIQSPNPKDCSSQLSSTAALAAHNYCNKQAALQQSRALFEKSPTKSGLHRRRWQSSLNALTSGSGRLPLHLASSSSSSSSSAPLQTTLTSSATSSARLAPAATAASKKQASSNQQQVNASSPVAAATTSPTTGETAQARRRSQSLARSLVKVGPISGHLVHSNPIAAASNASSRLRQANLYARRHRHLLQQQQQQKDNLQSAATGSQQQRACESGASVILVDSVASSAPTTISSHRRRAVSAEAAPATGRFASNRRQWQNLSATAAGKCWRDLAASSSSLASSGGGCASSSSSLAVKRPKQSTPPSESATASVPAARPKPPSCAHSFSRARRMLAAERRGPIIVTAAKNTRKSPATSNTSPMMLLKRTPNIQLSANELSRNRHEPAKAAKARDNNIENAVTTATTTTTVPLSLSSSSDQNKQLLAPTENAQTIVSTTAQQTSLLGTKINANQSKQLDEEDRTSTSKEDTGTHSIHTVSMTNLIPINATQNENENENVNQQNNEQTTRTELLRMSCSTSCIGNNNNNNVLANNDQDNKSFYNDNIQQQVSGAPMLCDRGDVLIKEHPLHAGDMISAPEDHCNNIGGLTNGNKQNAINGNKNDDIKKLAASNRVDFIDIRLQPICDYYDLETRPFARGKFAQVKRCINKSTKQCFAAKCIKKRRRLVDIRHEILLEIEALKLSYYTEHIVRLFDVFETPNEMILVLEMANGGELQRVLDDEELIDERIACRMVSQILDGLICLHDNCIAHLDLKPQNILLTNVFPNCDVKLCDFGISRRITSDCEIREICGTPDYVAPEILRYDPISLATDMWSLGVLTYVLLSGYSPFGSENKQQTYCNITQATLEFPCEIFDRISSDAIDFICKLIVLEPSKRLTSRQARQHYWLLRGASDCNGSDRVKGTE